MRRGLLVSLILLLLVGALLFAGCGRSDSAENVTCEQALDHTAAMRRIAGTVAALDLRIPYAHNTVKRRVEAVVRDVCAGSDPDFRPYREVVARLEAQQ